MKKKKTIYLLDYKLKWKTFKLLRDKLVKQTGPIPERADKILWQMMKDKKILCWFSEDFPNDMHIGLKFPKNININLISNPQKNETKSRS